MGHIHLAVLPKSRAWRDVVGLLEAGAPDDQVIAASAIAAEKDLAGASDNPAFVEAVRLLFMIPHAARSEDFGGSLRALGLDIQGTPGLLDLVTATGSRLDHVAAKSGVKSDMAELAGRALIGTLGERIGDALPGLFETTPDDVRLATRALSGRNGIAGLARGFFGKLTADCLASWLDRTLSAEIGAGGRFATAAQRSAFDNALAQYTAEATRIIKEFAPGWYGKRLHEEREITTRQAAAFGAVAFKKIREELRLKRGDGE